jgi:hypothetical protein
VDGHISRGTKKLCLWISHRIVSNRWPLVFADLLSRGVCYKTVTDFKNMRLIQQLPSSRAECKTKWTTVNGNYRMPQYSLEPCLMFCSEVMPCVLAAQIISFVFQLLLRSILYYYQILPPLCGPIHWPVWEHLQCNVAECNGCSTCPPALILRIVRKAAQRVAKEHEKAELIFLREAYKTSSDSAYMTPSTVRND